MADATGTSSYVYDSFGELTSCTSGAGKAVTYGYDADGDLTGVTYPLGSPSWAATSTVGYTYDHAGTMTTVTDFNGNAITITPTADGLPATEALGSTGGTVTTSYDQTDSPASITLKSTGGTTLQSFTYADSPAGTILNETDTPTSAQSPAVYTYDAKGRITSMTPGTGSTLNYGFDASSDLTTLPTGASGTYDNAGELSSSTLNSTTTSYTFNADGQQLAAKQGSTTITSGTWNGAGQLTAWTSPSASMTAATYNGDGIRTSSTTSGTTQNYTWNTDGGGLPQLLMDSTNAYIYDGGTAPREQVNLATGTITYLSTDSLGSVRGTVNSSGSLTGTASYDAWGNPASTGGLTATTPYGYAGGYTDPTTQIYLIHRYYQPSTGQFTSVDPALAQTNAPYAYADGDPVTNTDPAGLENVLGNHDTCVGVSNGQLKAKICVEVNISTSWICPGATCRSEPQTVAKVTSSRGSIAEVGVEKMGLEVCRSHGPWPGHPYHCTQNNEVWGKTTAHCTGSNASQGSTGRKCYVNGGWYTSVYVNWEAAWAHGAWIKWKGRARRSRLVDIHEHPLCRNGNNGTRNGVTNPHQCDPNW
jgi:RHS repeat-associated protein